MSIQIPQEFLYTIAKERNVSDAELETAIMALEGNSTAAIAARMEISNIAVRKRLGEVYRKFNISGRGPGKLAELRHQLFYIYEASPVEGGFLKTTTAHKSSLLSGWHQQDWGEAPELSQFYDRSEDLATLRQWVLEDNCRLLALLGMCGNGKTSLAVQLAKNLLPEFECVVWRSLRQAPPLEDILASLLQVFSPHKKGELPSNSNAITAKFLDYLRKHRCLIIFDDLQGVMQKEELAGNYRPGYEGYRELLRLVGVTNHQSCIIFTSSEAPTELSLLDGAKVRSWQPRGSAVIVGELLQEKGLSPSPEEINILLERYGDNLLAFKIVAMTIQEFFDGDVGEFIQATGLFINDTISEVISHQFERLSSSEAEMMYWLAIESSPVSFSRLRELMLVTPPISELLKNLDSLGRRSLVEKYPGRGEPSFTLQPAILKYVAERLVGQACQEIQNLLKSRKIEGLIVLKTHTLKPLPPVKSKHSQTPRSDQLTIKLLNHHLQNSALKKYGHEETINILNKIIELMGEKSVLEVGYALKNLQTILAELGGGNLP
ncbi:MAG TPA: LuxR family transcriptional regulator [Oscillatoriaceae cyanobacterium M33_DOE_052]|uniref:LuxR family transcriptional regulator n=1 Tax=Planktothricoides sp. SpSt-374 TaxID=2282167 RepID=A0A7C3ZQD7_9CYAN|nr:LuxR family transcriptional regulator [Oscillatoriaceae cyanobacterium M33_DOE_052]